MRTRGWRFRTAVTAVCVIVLAACTPTPSVTGAPTTSSPPPPVPGFPDLSQFTPVDTQTYVMSYPYFNIALACLVGQHGFLLTATSTELF